MISDEYTKDFLIAELETAWSQVIGIDNRRGLFANFYNVGFLAVLAFVANLWSKGDPVTITTMILLTTVLLFAYLLADTVIGILESEREANVRYRKKINLIRELFLSDTSDPKILFYMERKELGIKDFSTDSESIDKIGGTLKGIFRMIELEKRALIVLGPVLWIAYFLPFIVSCLSSCR